jgi:hypothetical protein
MISPSSHQAWLFYSPLAQQAAPADERAVIVRAMDLSMVRI